MIIELRIYRFNFKEWLEKYDDRDSTCAFQMEGQMYIIGGNPGSNTERDNFVITSSLDFSRLPDLPIGFSFGRCASYGQGSTVHQERVPIDPMIGPRSSIFVGLGPVRDFANFCGPGRVLGWF